jgi:hypothetical protein
MMVALDQRVKKENRVLKVFRDPLERRVLMVYGENRV